MMNWVGCKEEAVMI